MKNKIYLPVWTDGLTYDEQHFVFWIANNEERVDEHKWQNPDPKKGSDRNREWWIEEHCSDRTFQTSVIQ